MRDRIRESASKTSPQRAWRCFLNLDKKPLRYELQAGGSFILYSIGVDLKDDHGRIGKADGNFTTDEGDWIWKYPRASE